MVVANMEHYLNLLTSNIPLFTVESILSAPEIVLHPHANELCKIMMVAMREVVDRYYMYTCTCTTCIHVHVHVHTHVCMIIPSSLGCYSNCYLSFSSLLHLLVLFIYNSTRRFPRWLDGSCIEAQPKHIPGQEQPITYTFFTDIIQHPDVNGVGVAVRDTILMGIQTIVSHVGLWKRYRLLWRVQRVNPSLIDYKIICPFFIFYFNLFLSIFYFLF